MDPSSTVWFTYKGRPAPRHITHLRIDPCVERIGNDAFRNFYDLVCVVIPSTVSRIGKRAFAGCRNLSDVQLHEGLETIGDNAFGACVALERLKIPDGVVLIGDNAFYWCEALVEISVPSTVQRIGCYAFARCGLLRVHLQNGTKSIGHRAFEYCSKLVDINLPEGLRWIDIRTFGGCASLCTVWMPSTIKKIDSCAFEDCISLVHVHLNEGLRCIGQLAFNQCTALSAIALPSSLKEIESQAFRLCTSLVGFEIPSDSTVAIPSDCFDRCNSLANFSVPPSVDPCCFPLLHGSDACNRYDHLPIHRLCYSSTNTTSEILKQALDLLGMLGDDRLKDAFGMTPFHIVATSSNLRPDILECLLDHYPTDMVWEEDDQENTMVDYLLTNKSSKALDLIKMVVYKLYVKNMCGWDIEASKKFGLFDGSRVSIQDDETREALVKKLLGHVGYYCRIETRSIMELAIWKMKIQELQMPVESAGSSEFSDRTSCRYRFGAEDGIKSVIEYLWDGESPTYSTATSTYPILDVYKSEPDSDSDSFETSSYETTRWPFASGSESEESGSEWDTDDSSSFSSESPSDSGEFEAESGSTSSSESESSSSVSDSDCSSCVPENSHSDLHNPASNRENSKLHRRRAAGIRTIATNIVKRLVAKIPKRRGHSKV